MKQVWIEENAHTSLIKYCTKHDTKIQGISTKCIEIGLKELERQQKEMENKCLLVGGSPDPGGAGGATPPERSPAHVRKNVELRKPSGTLRRGNRPQR